MGRNSIYLTGCEYNRLLQEDPTSSQTSFVPSEPLWNGSSQFWLFERVYCTKESVDCEQYFAEAMSFASSRITTDLVNDGIIQPFDLASLDAGSTTREAFAKAHRDLRAEYSEADLRAAIQRGDTATLETIKLQLLGPIQQALRCAYNVSPNSVTTWFRGDTLPMLRSHPVTKALDILAKAVAKRASLNQLGMTLCRPPGTGIDPAALRRQRRVERTVQKELVPDLFLGKLSIRAYLDALLPHADAFRPMSDQLWADWTRNRSTLLRLRELAQQHLWKDLHNDWLPRLHDDPRFETEFRRLVADGINRARMGPFLNLMTPLVIYGSAGAVAAAATAMAGPYAGAAAGASTVAIVKKAVDDKLKASEGITLFCQRVRRVANARPSVGGA